MCVIESLASLKPDGPRFAHFLDTDFFSSLLLFYWKKQRVSIGNGQKIESKKQLIKIYLQWHFSQPWRLSQYSFFLGGHLKLFLGAALSS